MDARYSMIIFIKMWIAQSDKRLCNVRWFEDRHIKIYLRLGKRVIDNVTVRCLDIGNVGAEPQGQGHFTKLLTKLEQTEGWDVLYVENVLDPRFQKFFEKRGYQRHGECSFYHYAPRTKDRIAGSSPDNGKRNAGGEQDRHTPPLARRAGKRRS